MGLEHSRLYTYLVTNKEFALEKIEDLKYLENLELFTKSDILALCNDSTYKELFEDKILRNHVTELYFKLSEEDYFKIIINSMNLLKTKMFYELIINYIKSKSILKKLRTYESFNYLFQKYALDIITKKVVLKEKNLLEFLKEKEIINLIRYDLKYLPKKELKEFINEVRNNKKYLEEIFNNIESYTYFLTILKEASNSDYFLEIKEKCKDKIYSVIYGINSNKFINSDYKNSLELILNECLEKTSTKLEDIEYLREGVTSKVYKIGSLVLKVGFSRYVHEIPNSDKILYPLLRRKINVLNLYLEISDLTDTKNITDDDVYKVFKELMDDGIVWIDARKDNLGKLLKDSNSYGIYINENSVGLKGKCDNNRKKGDFVVIDTDLLFYDGNVPWNYLNNQGVNLSYYNKMMDKYISEKSKRKLKQL